MAYTNIHKLPPAVFAAMSKNRYVPGEKTDISVTRLIDSPRIAQLVKKHGYGSQDIMDTTASFIGTALHGLFEEEGVKVGAIVEERFYGDFTTPNGTIKLSGQIDIFYPEAKVLQDYKSTKSWKLVMGDLDDVEAQLNVNAELMRMNGFHPVRLEAVFFILDWMEGNKMREGYPQTPIVIKAFPMWSREFVVAYINNRLKAHAQDMPECTAKEMWARGEAWAVMKKGRKSALKIEGTKEAAWNWCLENGHAKFTESGTEDEPDIDMVFNSGIYIEYRKPKYVRCEKFCPCSEHCSQFKDINC